MPTPESDLFRAAKPKVPPTFDGVDYDDQERFKQAQDAIIRENWIQAMMLRLIRDELATCYRKEGVNHLEKCGKLRGERCGALEDRRRRLSDALHIYKDFKTQIQTSGFDTQTAN